MDADDDATNDARRGSKGIITDSFGTFATTTYPYFSSRVEGASTVDVIWFMLLLCVIDRYFDAHSHCVVALT